MLAIRVMKPELWVQPPAQRAVSFPPGQRCHPHRPILAKRPSVFADHWLARRHAEIRTDGDRYLIEELRGEKPARAGAGSAPPTKKDALPRLTRDVKAAHHNIFAINCERANRCLGSRRGVRERSHLCLVIIDPAGTNSHAKREATPKRRLAPEQVNVLPIGVKNPLKEQLP